MRLVIAGGKGGTGKTSVAAGLGAVWKRPLCLVDADVECPNLHLTGEYEQLTDDPVIRETPVVDHDMCVACGRCTNFCRYGALAMLGGKVAVFNELCHGCGGCFVLCPENAITPENHEIGRVMTGKLSGKPFVTGRMRVGEEGTPSVTEAVFDVMDDYAAPGMDILVDGPPGTSCPAMSAADKADMILMVTEPTPFGINDLLLAAEAYDGRAPLGVVLNRVTDDDALSAEAACQKAGLKVFAKIPFDRTVAEAHAAGTGVASSQLGLFDALAERIVNA